MILSAQDQIRKAVTEWEGVEVMPHRFGGMEFRYGRRELGHIHGDSLADLPFPMNIRNQLIRRGIAKPHHILPKSGWVSIPLNSSEDIKTVIDLFRRSWELARDSAQSAGGRIESVEGGELQKK